MGLISYSYDDFTTKGHGVIEGPTPSKKRSKKKNKKNVKQTKELTHDQFRKAYKQLKKIHNKHNFK